MISWICVIAAFAALCLYVRNKYQFFKEHGINCLPPKPIVGNLLSVLLRREHSIELLSRLYNAFPEDRFVGHYEFMTPVIFIRDTELIKQICVKQFDYFLDHRVTIDEHSDPLFGPKLASLKGQKWRDMRTTLSPAFTSSKMRLMVPFMLDCGKEVLESLKLKMNINKADYLDLDVLDLSKRYGNDVIASCAFGLKVNSLADEENEFYAKGKAALSFNFTQILKFFAFFLCPALMRRLKIGLFPKEVCKFFRNIVLGTMKNREDNNIIRPDMIHLLMEAKRGNLKHDDINESAGFATADEAAVDKVMDSRVSVWTDDDLVAQAILFFVAGFETMATAITFLLYELALNPMVQTTLVKEIIETNRICNGKIDYNIILQMKYMDMVVSESLRKWPPAIGSDRLCMKTYNLGKVNSSSIRDVIIQPGQGVFFPVHAIHHNSEYYPEPDKFDPERFSDENKHKIKPFTYLPFGTGPRNCIGSRFALLEIKIIVHQILSNFVLEPCAKSTVPIELSTEAFTMRMKAGHWLRFRSRNQ